MPPAVRLEWGRLGKRDLKIWSKTFSQKKHLALLGRLCDDSNWPDIGFVPEMCEVLGWWVLPVGRGFSGKALLLLRVMKMS